MAARANSTAGRAPDIHLPQISNEGLSRERLDQVMNLAARLLTLLDKDRLDTLVHFAVEQLDALTPDCDCEDIDDRELDDDFERDDSDFEDDDADEDIGDDEPWLGIPGVLIRGKLQHDLEGDDCEREYPWAHAAGGGWHV